MKTFRECASGKVKISYQIDGQASGEPLLLLMGLGASSRKWAPHIAAYRDYFRVIAPDNRGSGTSDSPAADTYSIREMAEDALAVLDAEGIQSAHVNGISMGGAIALWLAIHHPDRVRSLVLTNAFPRCSVSFRRSIEFLRDSRDQLDGRTFGRILQWIIYASRFQETDEAYILDQEANDADAGCPMSAAAFKAQCNGILGFDLSDRLGEIHCPTLIAAGESDLFVPEWLAMEMVRGIPGAELYMCPDGGHVQHWEQLEKYNERSLRFLLAHRTEQ